jgi:hypothetical protein
VDPVFPDRGWALVVPLAVGAGSYVLLATLCGSLYGLSRWGPLALLLAGDGVLRAGLVGGALAFTHDIVLLAWMVVIPFPLAIALIWPGIRRGFAGRSDLDVGYRALGENIARTVLASIATASLVSGFPLVLGLAAAGVSRASLGELVFTITLVRAPLIISLMAVQSLLVVRFRDAPETRGRFLAQLLGAIAAGTVVLAAAGWAVGQPVLEVVAGRPTDLDGAFIALLVLSSGLVAALSATGAVVLALRSHSVYLAGWIVAVVGTVAALFLPLPFVTRVDIAVIAGPLAGLAVHVGWLVAVRRGARR